MKQVKKQNQALLIDLFFDHISQFQVEKALNIVANKSPEIKNIKASTKPSENKIDPNQTNSKNPSLKGVSQSLIDKVCEK